METLLALAALSFGDERHDVADLVLAGLLTGEWQALEDLVARGLGLETDRAGQIDAGEVDRAPLPAVATAATWTTPRDIDSLEYFASANDICRAYASLDTLTRRPGLSQIGEVLSLNDDGLALDPAQWKTT